MNEIIISLMILVSSTETGSYGRTSIELKKITIYESCYTWYQKNVEMTEKKTTLFSRRSYHKYDGQRVVGYVCNNHEPE